MGASDDHMNEKKLFFGIPLEPRSQKRILRAEEGWDTLPLFLSRPEFLHVTVFFMGFLKNEDIAGISEAARRICAEVEPFDIVFDEITLAPDTDEPKMIWLSGVENESLLLLRNAFEREFSEKLAENKRFRPHVTLARIRRSRWSALPPEKLPAFPIPISIVESVSSVVLFESTTEGGGRQYIPLDEYPLG